MVVGSFYKDPLRPSLLIRRTERGARHENRANRPTDLLSLGAEVNIRPITLNATPAKRLNDAADLARAISGKIKLIINRGSTVEFCRPVFTPNLLPRRFLKHTSVAHTSGDQISR